MSTLGSFVAGIIGLSILQVALTSSESTAAVISVPAHLLSRWINPTIPLIPDLRQTP